MTNEEIQKVVDIVKQTIQKAVPPVIEVSVNGKIKDLSKKFDDYVVQDTKDKESIMMKQQVVEEKIDSVTPTVKQTKDILDFATLGSKVVGYIIRGLIAIGAASAVVFGGWTFISKYLKK